MPMEQRQRIAKVQMGIGCARRDFNGAVISFNRLRQAAQCFQRNALADQSVCITRIKRNRGIKRLKRFLMAVLTT